MSDAAIISCLSPAKINLFLHITGSRDDGYHNLQTVFRLIDWGDQMHFLPQDDIAIHQYLGSALDTPTTELCQALITINGAETITTDVTDNLIFKAAKALLDYAICHHVCPDRLPRVHIDIDKSLPMGAGLGGGSSNAATTLLTLNQLWRLNVDQDQLIKIGAGIGADVPIFIFGKDAIATGIGETLTTIDLPDQAYLILTPDAHISTARLFAHPNLRRDVAPLSTATIRRHTDKYIQTLCAPYHNVFTPVVTELAPAVDAALTYLQGLEAQAQATARMTGSGSAVILPLDKSLMDDTMDSEALLADWVSRAPCPAYIARSL